MPERVKLPRKLSQEPGAPPPQRPSHQRIIEELDDWANSPGLQPPTDGEDKKPDDRKARSRAGRKAVMAGPDAARC
ncbi:hypothetical protein [Bradyrhizobium sp. ORS 111]|uniref:hypothetical protein n=1 Tax=Bradyrhizobium sp. ORS 111 TaxID=1685958 RepID=UPI00388ECAFF